MGYPLTPDLRRQVGGLTEMQTSIAGAAGYRTWLLAAAILGSFWACLASASRFLRPAEGWLWGSAVAATVVGVGLTLALPGELRGAQRDVSTVCHLNPAWVLVDTILRRGGRA